MTNYILLGTADGLSALDLDGGSRRDWLSGHSVDALLHDGGSTWAIVDGKTIQVIERGRERHVAALDAKPGTCLAMIPSGLLVGTEEAHLFTLAGEQLAPIASFETVDGRDSWHTPWGDPADVRSIAVGLHDASSPVIYVNVHVGGVVRSTDGGESWKPTLDIEVDVHQVIAHPTRRGAALVAAYEGFGESRDGGETWQFITAGMHAHYCRAVAVADDTVLVSASTGPGGKRAAIYKKPFDGSTEFERCRSGLPEWFNHNIDTACLAARGRLVVFGTEDGRVFRSRDAGESWELIAKGLPEIHSAVLT